MIATVTDQIGGSGLVGVHPPIHQRVADGVSHVVLQVGNTIKRLTGTHPLLDGLHLSIEVGT